MEKQIFILSASDMDSIAGSKVIAMTNSNSVHLSSSRRQHDFPDGSVINLVRSYLPIETVLSLAKRFEVVIFDLDISDLFSNENQLIEAGCVCHWAKHNQPVSEYIWEYYFPNKSKPIFLRAVKDYVRWTFQMENSLAIHYAYEIIEAKFGNQSQAWFNALLSDDVYILQKMIDEGKEIHKYLHSVHKQLNNELCFNAKLDDHSLICANIPGANSLFFSDYLDLSDYDAALIFRYQPSIHKIRHSVYRIAEDVDVSTLAKSMGGGGHSYAAGFTTNTLPFKTTSSSSDRVDYEEIINKSLMSAPVLKYIERNIYGWQKNAFYGTIFGEPAVFYNSPYLVQTDFFKSINTRDCKVKVLFCLNSQNLYRIACQSVDQMPLPSKFGSRHGDFSIDVVPHLHHATFNDSQINKDIFSP